MITNHTEHGATSTTGAWLDRGGAPGPAARSLMWAELCISYFRVDRDRDDYGVIVTQILPFADPVVLDLFDGFENGVRGG